MLETHSQMLIASGIREDVSLARGYETLSWNKDDEQDQIRLRKADIPAFAIPYARNEEEYTGLLIPVYSPSGERVSIQWRPDFEITRDAETVKIKYVHALGAGNRLDVHPLSVAHVGDSGKPLVITEGIKKADCLTSRGHVVIALSGVDNWQKGGTPIADWDAVCLDKRKVYVVFDSDGVKNRQVNNAINKLVKFLESKGADVVAKFTPEEFNGTATKGIDDYIVAGGSFESAIERGSDPVLAKKVYFDHSHIAELVASEVLTGHYCYTNTTGWLQYNDKIWERCGDELPTEAIRKYIAKHHEGAAKLWLKSGSKLDEEIMKGWKYMLSGSALFQILKLCRGISPLNQRFEEFDLDRDVLNVQNGLLNLRTGLLEPHNYSQLVTKICPVKYDARATHKDWDKALECIPADLLDWAQMRYGQAITGHLPGDDTLVIEYGRGANGKSTLVDGFSGALGPYYRLVSNKVLLASNNEGVPTEFMDLKGLRFAQLEETPEARRLDVNRMKQVVGTSQITARYMRQDSITFDATHTMFIATNNIPVVNETEEAAWRRLLLFKFPYVFRKKVEDIVSENDRLGEEGLKQRVKFDTEIHEAVLAWMVKGAVEWYERKQVMPSTPEKIEKDTYEWRGNSDLVMRFFDEKLVTDLHGVVSTKDLHTVLGDWLEGNGHRPWSIEVMNTKFLGHELFVRAGTEKKKVRGSKVNSRPRGRDPLENKPLWTLTGVRFRTAEDDDNEQDV